MEQGLDQFCLNIYVHDCSYAKDRLQYFMVSKTISLLYHVGGFLTLKYIVTSENELILKIVKTYIKFILF